MSERTLNFRNMFFFQDFSPFYFSNNIIITISLRFIKFVIYNTFSLSISYIIFPFFAICLKKYNILCKIVESSTIITYLSPFCNRFTVILQKHNHRLIQTNRSAIVHTVLLYLFIINCITFSVLFPLSANSQYF